jgi:hypothetical protein
MSNFSGILDLLDEGEDNRDINHISASEASNKIGPVVNVNLTNNDNSNIQEEINTDLVEPFNVQLFANEIKEKSEKDNKLRKYYSETINGYSIGHDCIGSTVLTIQNYPIKSFAHKWLPIVMRAALGNAVHDFIQKNSNQFSEQEKSIKVPSIRCSVRLDCLISYNILVEIKSCTYDDYRKILKTKTPRIEDFYQTIMYIYLLENHLQEAKSQPIENLRTPPPALDKYKIEKIQFIYVAHDILSSDVESFSQCINITKQVKKLLNSKNNKFFFITTVTVDLKDIDTSPYINYVKNKIDRINWYVDNKQIPTIDDEFVDTKKCFFCLYNYNCPIKKNN